MSYEDYTPILQQVVNLSRAVPMTSGQIRQYSDLVPNGLQEVWRRHGSTLLIGDGRMQFCDPTPIQAALAPWFEGDPDLRIDRLVPYAYSSTEAILLTDGTFTRYDLDMNFSRLTVSAFDTSAGQTPNLDAHLVRSILAGMTFEPYFDTDVDFHAEGEKAFGQIKSGEAFGWEPPFQVVMNETNQLQKFDIAQLVARLQAIGPLELHRAFRNEIDAAQYGGVTFVRTIGSRG